MSLPQYSLVLLTLIYRSIEYYYIHGTMLKCPYELVFGQPPRHTVFPGAKGGRILEEEVDDIIEDEWTGEMPVKMC